jgi:hypothetical protein
MATWGKCYVIRRNLEVVQDTLMKYIHDSSAFGPIHHIITA